MYFTNNKHHQDVVLVLRWVNGAAKGIARAPQNGVDLVLVDRRSDIERQLIGKHSIPFTSQRTLGLPLYPKIVEWRGVVFCMSAPVLVYNLLCAATSLRITDTTREQTCMTPIRLIQVGLGEWGRSWAKLVAQQGELAYAVAYVDVQPAMLRQLQADLGVSADVCFPSLDAALAAIDADAVLVTTALAGHVPVVLAALAANKHVLVEKPFAPSLAQAQQAVDLAAAQNRVLMVSQNYRFYPAAQTAAKLIRNGALGPVSAVGVQFRKYANTAPPGAHWHYVLQHPLLMDMAIHHFDLMRFVLDQEPERITCHAWNPPWSNFTDPAAAVATITFDGGAVVQYAGSWVSTAAPTAWAGAWQIECAEGTIGWTGRDDLATNADAVMIRRRGKRARRVPLPALPYWDRAGALAAFAAAVRDGTTPPASGQDNLQSLALMFAAIKSAATGELQTVNAVLPGGAAQD